VLSAEDCCCALGSDGQHEMQCIRTAPRKAALCALALLLVYIRVKIIYMYMYMYVCIQAAPRTEAGAVVAETRSGVDWLAEEELRRME
jgi:hypothetical protein